MKTQKELTSISKFLSLVLRHKPQPIGLTLGEGGWVAVQDLLNQCAACKHPISLADLQLVVAGSDKQRFAFSDDGQRIRANQGHSVDVDLGLAPIDPPDVLFHGTASRFLAEILRSGLDKRARHHVHLTQDVGVARSVGQRYGAPVVLRIRAEEMAKKGHQFCCTANGVWLTEHVPPEFLEVLP